MKTKTLFYMALMAVMMTLAACSQDDELMDAAPKATQIEFEITDGGFADVQTRAVEDGYSTKFTANDECGLYVVKSDGTFAAENVKLTAEERENGITWKVADGAISGAADGDKCFLYYPYQSTGMKNKVNPSATDSDDAFFSNLINNWIVDPVQNDYKLYTWSDLMTAASEVKNEGGKLKVSFSLNHKMTLAIIEVPKTKYKFTNVPDGAEYIVPTLVDFSSHTKPLRMADGTYRFIVNTKNIDPVAGCIKGTVPDGKKFTINLGSNLSDCAGGKCKRLKVGGVTGTPIEKEHTLQVGDYLLKDGNLIRQDALTAAQKADVAAVVFAVGHNNKDNSSYLNTGLKSVKCSGYAVALKDVEGKQKWANERTAITTSQSMTDWSGYSSQQVLVTEGLDKFPAAKACAEYGTKEGESEALSTSSGWFLPAVGQMKACLGTTVKNAINQCGGNACTGNYWSSTTTGTLYNVYTANSPLTSPGIYSMHDNEFNVRPVLAF